MPTRCNICKKASESVSHIVWHFRFGKQIWAWVAGIFKLRPSEDLVVSYKAAKGCSKMIKDLWLVANLAITTELWKLRNKVFFEGAVINWMGFKGRVYQVIRDNLIRLKGYMFNTVENLCILNYFKVQHRSCKLSMPIEVSWSPPEVGEVMICCDGASLGNPVQAGAGVSFRDFNSRMLGALCVNLGWRSNFYAEVCAVIYGLMIAKRWNVPRIFIRSDSMRCIQALQKGEVLWDLAQKWRMARDFYSKIRYIHSYKEVNFSADSLAKQACLLAEYVYKFYEGRTLFMRAIEWPGEVYFRFK
ncbi:uncharacterized protein LOC113333013 [Papaver somniferum]|uniref:uncharacterized protein LOC113333013 n=1 Tax=Papaver somniferum TaxID=3469 RepID=UPI000E7006A6|nr:uncharacterized protein LOC113333013 [Papaver somniferum]